MKDLLKDKRILVAGVVVLVIIVASVFILFGKKNSTDQATNTNILPTQVPIPTITADSIGLTLKSGASGKTVIVTVAKPAGITGIDYELSYTSKGDIPRGAIGTMDLTKKPVTKEITLGTCSDVCHYDEGVSDIKLILKVTKSDSKVYQAEADLSSLSQ